jgi:phosphomannomutase
MKPAIVNQIMVEKQLPTFAETVSRVNYEDGCKVYFENGDFVICRFSGTEPLLRIFAESSTAEKAETYIQAFRDLVAL